ncbi:hypothetical protein NBRC116592_34860 [Colwellia sp. KU-HH00111]|uniref:M56 family metallopeptidase n=1 Tax=Colwellia sp. KU-HH00111 TaxID=3127652 RepID=UPI0031077407
MAAVLKSTLLIFNHSKAQLRYALSTLAMLSNLLLPIITFVIIYRAELTSASASVKSVALSELIQELKQPDALFSFKELTELLPSLLPYISFLWLTTVTLLAGKLLIEITRVNKLPQQGAIAPSQQLQTRFEQLAKQLQLTIMPQLLISLKVEVPMAIGWLKPVVLLPANMISGLNSAQLEMLILHELAHIRRHDYLVNFIQTLVEILLFFHPGVLWVSKQMRNEREYCSDDIAVQHCGDAVAYAHTLADTASLCTRPHNHTIPDMAMAASGGDLKQRVIRLVDHHCAPKNNISKWFASATIIFSVLLLSSKQLLTMPLLDILHNENPWKQPKTAKDSHFNAPVHTDISSSDLPSQTIAQQLLAPPAAKLIQTNNDDPQSSNQQPDAFIAAKTIKAPLTSQASKVTDTTTIAETTNQIKSIENRAILPEPSSIIEQKNTEQSQTERVVATRKDERDFNTQLDSLSVKASGAITKTITQNLDAKSSSMVEKAFERTSADNPYQAELTSLSASQETNTSTNNAIPTDTRPQKLTLAEPSIATNPFGQFDKKKVNNQQTPQLSNARLSTTEMVDNKTQLTAFSDNSNVKTAITSWQNAEQLKSVDPVYPSVAERKGIEIEVEVHFTIDVNGHIKDIKFAHQDKVNYFKSSIRSAIKKWRFIPAKVDNQPVESHMAKVFAFSLQS